LLLLDPFALFELGFQLSFIAVLTLLNFRHNLFLTTLLLSIINAPYILYTLGTISFEPIISSVICMQIFGFILMPLLFITLVTGFPPILVQITTLSFKYFLLLVSILQHYLTTRFYLRLTGIGVCIWSTGLALWVLLQMPALSLFLCGFTFLFAKPKRPTIAISKDGRNIAFISNCIVYAKNIDSHHAQMCRDFFGASHILPIPTHCYVSEKAYYWHGITLNLTNIDNRFTNATYGGLRILRRWDLNLHKSGVLIIINNGQVDFKWT
jgi:hypothetical protein